MEVMLIYSNHEFKIRRDIIEWDYPFLPDTGDQVNVEDFVPEAQAKIRKVVMKCWQKHEGKPIVLIGLD